MRSLRSPRERSLRSSLGLSRVSGRCSSRPRERDRCRAKTLVALECGCAWRRARYAFGLRVPAALQASRSGSVRVSVCAPRRFPSSRPCPPACLRAKNFHQGARRPRREPHDRARPNRTDAARPARRGTRRVCCSLQCPHPHTQARRPECKTTRGRLLVSGGARSLPHSSRPRGCARARAWGRSRSRRR